MNKNIYTENSLAFFTLVEEIMEGKDFSLYKANKNLPFIYLEFNPPNIGGVSDENRFLKGHEKVSKAAFLAAIEEQLPNKTKVINFTARLFGHEPSFKNDTLTAGCQKFSKETVEGFIKEYKEWRKAGPKTAKLKDCHTDSSTALRVYAKEVCPPGINNGILDPNSHYPYLKIQDNSICGAHNKEGEYLTPGQFIDRLLSAKQVKEEKGINVKTGYNSTAYFDIKENGVEGGSWGIMSHEEMEKFIAEFEEKV